ncbi:MAG: FKBP-type peptidyl-prolyl cis-trans isomerase [Bacteriovoracaceae bacterium]|nr:FKBP-type peptidyl-prolyl cis-trans isomerase [Bacteriovoracaceae bacterium]
MKKLVALAFCSVLLFSCNKGGGSNQKVDLKTEDDKTFYAVGAMFGDRLSNLNLTEHEVNALVAGLRDKATNQKTQINYREYQSKVQALFKGRMSKNTDKFKGKGKDFIENFVKKEGASKTASGLAYKVISQGKGANPKPTDIVEVHYHGTLIDGTVFDSSKERGKKVKFPLNRVIKGWTEGLQLLQPGGKIKLVIPSELAYGDHGAPPKIPGGATLVFEVELFSVNSPEAPKAAPKSKKK